MKKIITLILALIITITALGFSGMPAFAFAPSVSTGLQKNPYYAGREIADSSLEEFTVGNSVSKKYGGKTYYTNGTQLSKRLADALESRSRTVTLYYLSTSVLRTSNSIINTMDRIFAEATDDSFRSTCTGGDYQRWSMDSWEADTYIDNYDGSYYYYRIPITYYYYDTAAQEKQVNAVVNSFVNGLDTNSMSDYQIIKAVHDFICDNTVYCYDALDDFESNKYAYSAYGALVKGSCVCQGYSLAFYRLCKELGYSARIITSEYYDWSTYSYSGHAWNLVGVGDYYYYVDATWDDEDEGVNYDYFLVNYKNLRVNDDAQEHVPEEKYFDGDYYYSTYGDYIDENNYNANDPYLLSNCVMSLSGNTYTYSGSKICPGVTVISPYYTELSSDNYRTYYKANINTGNAKAFAEGVGDYHGTSHRQFKIKPKKMGNLSIVSGGRAATSLKLKWTAAGGSVSGYKIEYYKNGKWSVVATVTGGSSNTATVKSLTPAKSHKFRIRAYKMASKQVLYGAYSNVYTTCTTPKTPALTLKTAKKSITASWKKLDATGYEVQLSTKSNFKSGVKKYTLGSKATSKKIGSLKSKTKYFVRVRSYKTIGGKKYYSAWSTVKSLKCK
ncbi:MAG: hypothetical protein E7571_06295 [Ruminococcaceae bacterium]|nr:hypothetical protein [Oscillospiraceae bacterium]